MKRYEFDAEILQSDEIGSGAFVLFPFDTMECFGKKNMIPVKVTFDGEAYRGSIANMGLGPCIGVLKSIRQKINKQRGDIVHVTVEHDTTERIVETPPELTAALSQNKSAADFFAALSQSHKREYISWISSARKQETRETRADKACELLAAGKKLK